MTNKTKNQMNKAEMKNTKGGALAIYGIRRYRVASQQYNPGEEGYGDKTASVSFLLDGNCGAHGVD
jgi:hypothetical protein